MNTPRQLTRKQSWNQPSSQPRSTAGNRNAERMYQYNDGKDSTLPWAEQSDEHYARYQEAINKPRPQKGPSRNARRAQEFRNKKKGANKEQPTPEESLKATVETPEKAAPMYATGPITQMMPITSSFGYNPDFAGYMVMIQCTYDSMREVDERISRKLPYCVFQMYCVTALHAAILHVKYNTNKEGISGISNQYDPKTYFPGHIIPGPIAEYLTHMVGTHTLSGDNVRMNIPDIYVPQTAGQDCAGSLGPVTDQTHNVYECVPAPIVSRRYIEYSLNHPRDNVWKPLPDNLFDQAGKLPTANLLGFGPLEDIHNDTKQSMRRIVFPSDTQDAGVITRLQYSDQVADMNQRYFRSIEDKYSMTPMFPPTKLIPGFIGFVETSGIYPSNNNVSQLSATLFSSAMAGVALANEMYLMSLRRRRNEHAPGCCYINANGTEINGWTATRNQAFTSTAPFSLQDQVHDLPLLRHAQFVGPTSFGSRVVDYTAFITRNFLKKSNK